MRRFSAWREKGEGLPKPWPLGTRPTYRSGRWPMLSPEAVSGRYRSTQTSGFVPPPHACKAGLGSSQTAT
eukprot:1159491-Prymnesium_polylepis.3